MLHRQIFFLTLILNFIGLIILFSASGILGYESHGTEFYYISRQLICASVGFFIMVILSNIRYQSLRPFAEPLFFAQLALLVFSTFSQFALSAQGAKRWLQIGGFTIQPSELAKISLSIFLAHLLFLKQNKILTRQKIVLSSILIGLLLSLIFKQPDLGMTLLMGAVAIGVFFLAGAPLIYIVSFFLIGGGFAFISMLSTDYRKRRLLSFLNPWEDPHGSGFQSVQSYLSFHSGKLFGVGLGNGNSKLFFLPEVHTDFIFALVGEELGFLGTAGLLFLFVYLLILLFKVVMRTQETFGRYLAFSITLFLALQILVNFGGVTGLLPVKGLPLPFISWGRSALLAHLIMIGIILNIAKQTAAHSNS